jgi:hypothetical protein
MRLIKQNIGDIRLEFATATTAWRRSIYSSGQEGVRIIVRRFHRWPMVRRNRGRQRRR